MSKEGLFRTATAVESKTDRIDHNPPFCLLRLPYKEAEKWGDAKTSGESLTGKIETVKVPAGTFEAIRVDRRHDPVKTFGGQSSFWYVPGVGAVKLKINDLVVQMKSITQPKK